MSQENVAQVRGVIDAHDRGDFAAVFAAYDPAIEWRMLDEYSSLFDFKPVYYGHEGVRAFWRGWFSAMKEVTFEYEEFIDAGESVVAILTQRMQGRTSGVSLEWRSYAQVWTVQDAKIVRVEFFSNRDKALEPVGLAG